MYILTNRTRTPYVRVTNGLESRMYEHRNKLVPGFTLAPAVNPPPRLALAYACATMSLCSHSPAHDNRAPLQQGDETVAAFGPYAADIREAAALGAPGGVASLQYQRRPNRSKAASNQPPSRLRDSQIQVRPATDRVKMGQFHEFSAPNYPGPVPHPSAA